MVNTKLTDELDWRTFAGDAVETILSRGDDVADNILVGVEAMVRETRLEETACFMPIGEEDWETVIFADTELGLITKPLVAWDTPTVTLADPFRILAGEAVAVTVIETEAEPA